MRNLTIASPTGSSLNADQQKAAKEIEEWYKSKELVCTLSGAAGTGKTYLLNYLLKHIFIHSTCVTAPTHKALKVVEKVTGKKGKTLQSLHGLRPNVNLEDFNVDNIKFDTLATETIRSYKLIIIDECSQVGTNLHKLNMQRAQQYNTKILYVGDEYQLPPIRERISPTFTISRKIKLTQIVRQEDSNPLLKVFKFLRSDIDNNSSTFLNHLRQFPININEQGEGYVCVDLPTFQTEIIKAFKSKEFENSVSDFTRYAAYTNESVKVWNNFIRTNTLPQHSDIISQDDLITGHKTIIDEYNNPIVINSEDYIIQDISRKLSDDQFEVFTVNFYSLIDGRTFAAYVVDHKHPTFNRFKQIVADLHFKALYSNPTQRGQNWKKFFNYKDRFNLLEPFFVEGQGDKKSTIPKDIDYGYCSTIHKLQGSTIQHIFVNLIDICYYGGNKNAPIMNTREQPYAIEYRNKLIYTALSRAKKIAVLLV